MRQNQQNKQRMRGRSRKGPNPLTRSYESNGPDVKIRGTALHIAEKYTQLARDASSSGDRVMAENYLQHAEHYYRIIATAQAALQPQFGREDAIDESEDDIEVPGSDRFEPRQIDFRPNGGQPETGGNGNGNERGGPYQPRERDHQQAPRGERDYQNRGEREGGYQQRDRDGGRGDREGGYQQRDNRGERDYQNRGEREGGYQQRDREGYQPRDRGFQPRGDREGYQPRGDRDQQQPRGDRDQQQPRGDRDQQPPRGDRGEGFQPQARDAAAQPGEGGEQREGRESRRNRRDRFDRFDRRDRGDRPQPAVEARAEAPTAPGGGPMPLDAPQPDVSFPDFITRPAVNPQAAASQPSPAPAPAAAPEPVASGDDAPAASEDGEGKKRAPRTRRAATTPRAPRARRSTASSDESAPEPVEGSGAE